MRANASGFGLWERVAAAATVLELFGEIDIEALTALGPAVEKLIDRQAPEVVVDLRPVTFLDAGGLRLLVAVQDGVAARGGTLRVVRGAPGVMRLFRFADLESAFVLLDRIPPALTDDANPPGPAPPTPHPTLTVPDP
ncbi:STAS domain-containing protein [Streptomyces sp. NBC_00083]|uniref:STAS domain-containing protein n=1 Tax=Streptomyces sp. NBC_00083 TaxID=2975647 RepID=UPI00225182D1|nr:STAS domain-containing protein [Streptomyces sp. NBC_00083]MCX5387708.1 STAS domain-containing protein [Streptomyces sp. NBC_00083]